MKIYVVVCGGASSFIVSFDQSFITGRIKEDILSIIGQSGGVFFANFFPPLINSDNAIPWSVIAPCCPSCDDTNSRSSAHIASNASSWGSPLASVSAASLLVCSCPVSRWGFVLLPFITGKVSFLVGRAPCSHVGLFQLSSQVPDD